MTRGQPHWNALPAEERARVKARQGVGYLIADDVRVVDDQMHDVPADAGPANRLCQRLYLPDALDHHVGAATGGRLPDSLVHPGIFGVQREVGAKRLAKPAFGIAPGNPYKGRGAARPGDLEMEQSGDAQSQHERAITGEERRRSLTVDARREHLDQRRDEVLDFLGEGVDVGGGNGDGVSESSVAIPTHEGPGGANVGLPLAALVANPAIQVGIDHHPGPRGEVGATYVGSDLNDPSHHLVAHDQRMLHRDLAGKDTDVGAADPCRADVDEDFARSRAHFLAFCEGQAFRSLQDDRSQIGHPSLRHSAAITNPTSSRGARTTSLSRGPDR